MSVSGTVNLYLTLRGFSWKPGINHFGSVEPRHHTSVIGSRICLRSLPTCLNRTPTAGWPSLLRPPIAIQVGAGILTCFPSATLLSLALGADSPCADQRCAGNLGLSACEIFTRIIVTHVSIRTSDTSSKPLGSPSTAYRTLLYHPTTIRSRIRSFGISLSPVKSSAQADSTSELLRFL